MLRIHCVQLCYNLSDPAMEGLLYEAESVRRFGYDKVRYRGLAKNRERLALLLGLTNLLRAEPQLA